jgi:hypothetical protein
MTDRQWKTLKIIALVVMSFPFVWFAFAFLVISIAASRNWSENELDESRLPKAVLALSKDRSNGKIEYHRLRNGFDLSMTDRGYIRIDGADLVQDFIDVNSLEKTDSKHPKRIEFESSIHLLPRTLLMDGDVWFASHGFGTVHQEVVDLYLLKTTEVKASALVYHYWTF